MNVNFAEQLIGRRIARKSKTVFIEDKRYIVKLADSFAEIDESLRLRFDVFNLELNEGLNSSYLSLRDEDAFDDQCHHLIVIERITGKIIGTYRMQTWEMAKRGIGFYSETEFRLKDLGLILLKRSVELGRACIAKSHRNGRVLFLLWKGIGQYMQMMQKRYLFGCCSLNSQDKMEGTMLMKHLETKGFVSTGNRIHPNPGYWCYEVNPAQNQYEFNQLPPLMDMYFRYGAKISSYPAIDREFKTIDFLVVLDSQCTTRETQKTFFS